MITRWFDWLLIIPHTLLPHHALSQIVYWLMRIRWRWLKNIQIRSFQRLYQVDMHSAIYPDSEDYACFNDFFTRALKPEARPIINDPQQLACPVDGAVNQLGSIEGDTIFQAKGHSYSLTALLGGSPQRAAPFLSGQFATLYLSPRDYHRIHCPVAARLVETVYIPGRLFNVGLRASRVVPELFARNERLVCLFEGEQGPFAMVWVGAIFVSSMTTVWAGVVPPKPHRVIQKFPAATAPQFQQGDELGRFNMGSTVILLTPPGVQWAVGLTTASSLKMGQALGQFTSPKINNGK